MSKIVSVITETAVAKWQRTIDIRATFTVHVDITHERQNLSTLNQLLKLTSAGKLYICMMFAQILLFTYTQGNIFLLPHTTDVFNCTGWSRCHSSLAMLNRNNLHEYLHEISELVCKKRDIHFVFTSSKWAVSVSYLYTCKTAHTLFKKWSN
jgi:hypothetical protein